MSEITRPDGAAAPQLPTPPFDVVVLGAGRVGGSYATALRGAGHAVLAELGRDDDPTPIARASVVVIAVPDDALAEAAALVARVGTSGAVVMHTCGIAGLEPLEGCGPRVAAVHPAAPVATREQRFDGITFGVTCAPGLEAWCEAFVRDLGGRALLIAAEQRPLYHAALVMASNFAVTIAGDAAGVLGGHEVLVPLLRATIENIAALGPDAALTGPVVRGDAGTVRAHLEALPPELLEPYVANARRTVARAIASGRLRADAGARILEVLEEAMVR